MKQSQSPFPQQQQTVPQPQPVATAQYPQALGTSPYPQVQPGVPQNVQYVTPTVQPQVVYQQAPTRTSNWEKYNGKASKILGWIQVVAGFLCIIFNAVGIAVQNSRQGSSWYYTNLYTGFPVYKEPNTAFYIGTGIWATIFFFISGGLAIGAARSKTTGLIVGSLVMNIFSTLVAFILLGTSSAAIGVESEERYVGYVSSHSYNHDGFYHYPDDYIHRTSLAMGALLLLLSILQILVTITTSSYACGAVCCQSRTTTSTQVITGTTNTQYIMTPQPGTAIPQAVAYTAYPQQATVGYPQAQFAPAYPQAAPAYTVTPAVQGTQPAMANPVPNTTMPQPGQPSAPSAESPVYPGQDPPAYEALTVSDK